MNEEKSQDRFVCHCGEYPFQLKSWIRRVCFDSPFYKELNGNRYCIFHYPDEEKRELFEVALEERIKQGRFHFEGAWFPSEISFHAVPFQSSASFAYSTFSSEIDFSYAEFYKSVSFDKAVFCGKTSFSGSTFNEIARFDSVKFEQKVNFEWAKFVEIGKFIEATFLEVAEFEKAKFQKDVDFSFAEFNKPVSFLETEFNQKADFSETEFKDNALFRKTLFKDYLYFSNENESYGFKKNLDLCYARTEQPEKVYFHSINLRPYWFINIDARTFNFINVNWSGKKNEIYSFTEELKESKKSGLLSDNLLKITFHQLAQNAEENNRYEEASNFRRMAFESEWKEKSEESQEWFNEKVVGNRKIKHWFGYKETGLLASFKKVLYIIRHFDFLHPLYRFTSYYGESWRRAFVILFFILGISTFLYTTSYCVFKDGKQGFDVWEAISYSLRVMALQRPEPFPENSFSKIIVALQTIFAPLQLALLALAIRRKFMR